MCSMLIKEAIVWVQKLCLLLFRHVALNYTLECSHIFVSTLQLLTMSHATNERIFCNVQTAQAPYLPKFSFLVFFLAKTFQQSNSPLQLAREHLYEPNSTGEPVVRGQLHATCGSVVSLPKTNQFNVVVVVVGDARMLFNNNRTNK